MAKKNQFAFVKRVCIICVPLILVEVAYVMFFAKGEVVTAQQAIERAASKIQNIDDRRRAMLKIQLAISDYMQKNNGRAPATLDELKGVYFDTLPFDPQTGKTFLYKVTNNRPQVGYDIAAELRNKAALEKLKNQVPGNKTDADSEADLEKVNFVYDPSSKRDPFRPFDLGPKPGEGPGKTPLERYDYGQLKLTAVLKGFDEPQAIVEIATGRGFTVKKGTKIGTLGGEVVSILPDRLEILETSVDFTGEKKTRTVQLRLRTKDQDRDR